MAKNLGRPDQPRHYRSAQYSAADFPLRSAADGYPKPAAQALIDWPIMRPAQPIEAEPIPGPAQVNLVDSQNLRRANSMTISRAIKTAHTATQAPERFTRLKLDNAPVIKDGRAGQIRLARHPALDQSLDIRSQAGKNLAPRTSVFIGLSKPLRAVARSQHLVRLYENRDPVRQQSYRPGEQFFLARA